MLIVLPLFSRGRLSSRPNTSPPCTIPASSSAGGGGGGWATFLFLEEAEESTSSILTLVNRLTGESNILLL